jgi:hypothetical protein
MNQFTQATQLFITNNSLKQLSTDLFLLECAGDALGMVAAVHVSVTGQSSDLTLVTPAAVVIWCPGGREGRVRGGAELIEVDDVEVFVEDKLILEFHD